MSTVSIHSRYAASGWASDRCS